MPDAQEQNPEPQSTRKPLNITSIEAEALAPDSMTNPPEEAPEEDTSPTPHTPRRRVKGKGPIILKMLKRKNGATVSELCKACGWQPHSVRAYISSDVRKRLGLSVMRLSRKDRQSSYYIAS